MRNKKIILIIITLAWVALIFSFSLQSGDVSRNISGSLVRKVLALFMPAMLEYPEQLGLLEFIVRKCAHFTEFMILGVFSSITLKCFDLRYRGLFATAFCIVVASMDETIQLFVSERAGRVQDILIDSAGALVGITIVVLWGRKNLKSDFVNP